MLSFTYFSKVLVRCRNIPSKLICSLKIQSALRNSSTQGIKMLNTSDVEAASLDACTDIVWMDLEMTGLNVKTDKILEVACLLTDKDLNIISEGPCFTIHQPRNVLDKMDDWCKKHHNETGLIQKSLESKISTAEGESILLNYLREHIPKGKCPLAGNSVYFDRYFLREHMPSVDDYLHYRIMDVSTVKELARRWNPAVMNAADVKKYVHRSLDDIKESIQELNYYRQHFFKHC